MTKSNSIKSKGSLVQIQLIEFKDPVLVGSIPEKRVDLSQNNKYIVFIDDDSRFVRVENTLSKEINPVLVPMSNVGFIQIKEV